MEGQRGAGGGAMSGSRFETNLGKGKVLNQITRRTTIVAGSLTPPPHTIKLNKIDFPGVGN